MAEARFRCERRGVVFPGSVVGWGRQRGTAEDANGIEGLASGTDRLLLDLRVLLGWEQVSEV